MQSSMIKGMILVGITALAIVFCSNFVRKISSQHHTAKVPERVRQAIAAADQVFLSLHCREGDFSTTISDKTTLKAIADSICVTKVNPVPDGLVPANLVFPVKAEIHGADSFVVHFMTDDFNVSLDPATIAPQYVCDVCDTRYYRDLLRAGGFPDPFADKEQSASPR